MVLGAEGVKLEAELKKLQDGQAVCQRFGANHSVNVHISNNLLGDLSCTFPLAHRMACRTLPPTGLSAVHSLPGLLNTYRRKESGDLSTVLK